MKKTVNDIQTVTVEVKFKDGTVLKMEQPATLLLSYQKFDIKDAMDSIDKTGKANIDPTQEDVGGVQILGTSDNLQFALFTLLRQLVDTMGAGNVVEVFNKTMMYIADKTIMDRKMAEAASNPNKKVN